MALVDVLFEGYIRDEGSRVASTVSLIRDGRATIIVDPGLVPGPDAILRPPWGSAPKKSPTSCSPTITPITRSTPLGHLSR